MRLLSEASYEAGSWGKERRVLYKEAEVLKKGQNTRFVVTNRSEAPPPPTLYDHYVQRGETENRT